jgi:tryptophan halogenase
MSGGSLLRVVVAGRDVDLWLCASALGRALRPAGVEVAAIELPRRRQPSHVSATLPPLEALHAKLEINEASLLRATGGSFSFGQNLVGAAGASGAAAQLRGFFHAWGAYGAPIDERPFFPCWVRARREGLNVPLHGFCLTAVAAQNGRMLLPDEATTAFGRTDYAYHLNTMAYAGYLKSLAVALGVRLYPAQSVEVARDESSGSIAALVVDGSVHVAGELFVDASGEDALLIGRALRVPREDWRQYFSVDRTLTARAPAFTTTPPFAEIRAAPGGWTALHPSRLATGVLHAYSQALVRDETALRAATAAAGIELADVSLDSVNPGLHSRVWEGNCVAVGRAACALDPIHDVDLHALQLGLVHLLSLIPVSEAFAAERAEYNRIMRSYYERIRDFQCAFYALAPFGGDFWRAARDRAVPPPLAHKIATFRACAAIAPMEDETFSPDSWQAQFTGLGALPESWPPAIDHVTPRRFQEEFRRMLDFIRAKVLEQPTHAAYLDSLCGSATR